MWGGTAAGMRGHRAGVPPRGPPKTTQHQQEKLQIRQKWGHHSKVLIYRHCVTSRKGGSGGGGQARACGRQGASPGAARKTRPCRAHPVPAPPLVTSALRGAPGQRVSLGARGGLAPRERGPHPSSAQLWGGLGYPPSPGQPTQLWLPHPPWGIDELQVAPHLRPHRWPEGGVLPEVGEGSTAEGLGGQGGPKPCAGGGQHGWRPVPLTWGRSP